MRGCSKHTLVPDYGCYYKQNRHYGKIDTGSGKTAHTLTRISAKGRCGKLTEQRQCSGQIWCRRPGHPQWKPHPAAAPPADIQKSASAPAKQPVRSATHFQASQILKYGSKPHNGRRLDLPKAGDRSSRILYPPKDSVQKSGNVATD